GAVSTVWQLQTVNEGGTTYLRVQNTADNKLLGYTYNETAPLPVPGSSLRAPGNFVPASLAPENCAGARGCDIKWIYKIYQSQKITQTMYPAPVLPGAYFINVTYDNKSMLAFGTVPVFGQTNPALPDMQWQFEQTSRGTYFIFNRKSNKALGVNAADNKFLFSAIDTGNFYNTDNLQWILKGPYEGKYAFVPLMDQQHPNTAIGMSCSNGIAVTMQQPVPGSYWQEFIIDSVNGPLWGYVDMHTHPMSHLAFAGKNFHGAPDIGSLMQAGTIYADAGFDVGETKPDCNPGAVRVTNVSQALGNCNATHGGWGTDNNCGDIVRNAFVTIMEKEMDGSHSAHGKDIYGYNSNPALAFTSWPRWNDMTHQKMWVDWIEMAYKSGLRVMVALAHNNKVMGEIIAAHDGTPKDDVSSADLQVKEIID
ncbi:MAG TPA: hypothetical protein VLD19_19240, partial [Chitinophagaceae bacterium]|nr:hypothetical protein [Chitinophagaceae bacterium]